MKTEILEKNIAVVLDGTSHLAEAFAIVERYVDNFQIEQRLIRLQRRSQGVATGGPGHTSGS